MRFAPGELAETLAGLSEAIVRPASGVAYVPEDVTDEPAEGVLNLIEAIRGQLDPRGVLA